MSSTGLFWLEHRWGPFRSSGAYINRNARSVFCFGSNWHTLSVIWAKGCENEHEEKGHARTIWILCIATRFSTPPSLPHTEVINKATCPTDRRNISPKRPQEHRPQLEIGTLKPCCGLTYKGISHRLLPQSTTLLRKNPVILWLLKSTRTHNLRLLRGNTNTLD